MMELFFSITFFFPKIKNGNNLRLIITLIMENLISVIIPVYNVEKYLEECLNSLVAQTYPFLEIILVNDGSNDACPEICEAYAQKDSRIKVVHKVNGGLSDARNFGLRRAGGDFIAFVDSDDQLSSHFCEKLLSTLLEHEADIAECNFIKFAKSEEIASDIKGGNDNIEIFNTEKALEELIKERQFKQVVWNKMYRKEVIGNFEFPVGKLNEDEFWTYKVFGNAKRIAKIYDSLYFYRQQSNSIMGMGYNVRRLDGLNALEERIYYMEKYFPSLVPAAVRRLFYGTLFHYHHLTVSKIDVDKTSRKMLVRNLRSYRAPKFIKTWKSKDLFWFHFFLIHPGCCVWIRRSLGMI